MRGEIGQLSDECEKMRTKHDEEREEERETESKKTDERTDSLLQERFRWRKDLMVDAFYQIATTRLEVFERKYNKQGEEAEIVQSKAQEFEVKKFATILAENDLLQHNVAAYCAREECWRELCTALGAVICKETNSNEVLYEVWGRLVGMLTAHEDPSRGEGSKRSPNTIGHCKNFKTLLEQVKTIHLDARVPHPSERDKRQWERLVEDNLGVVRAELDSRTSEVKALELKLENATNDLETVRPKN
eukprot:Selendium_serpulae@DN3924_c0_g1_i2.p1